MLSAPRLVGIARHFDGAVVGRRLTFDEPLRVEGPISACAVCDAFSNAASVCGHKPCKVKHLSKGNGPEVEVQAGNEDVVVFIEETPCQGEYFFYKLPFIDREAFNSL